MNTVTNPNDAVRRQMLQYFYDRNAAATSRQGKKGSAVKISDVKRELKDRHSLTQPQVMSNLTYLIDRGWVKTVEQEKSVSTLRGTVIPSVVTFYEITAMGIELLEGSSLFKPRERYPEVNIHATGSNVITTGDGNVVNVEYQDVSQRLIELRRGLALSGALDEAARFEALVDLETIRDQLAKPEPDAAAITSVWRRLSHAADLAGLSSLGLQIAGLLGPLVT